MLIFAAALLAGIAWRARRSPRHPRVGLTLKWVGMPVLALLSQLALGFGVLRHASSAAHFSLVVLSYSLVGVWLIVNTARQPARLRRGGAIASVGWLANVVAVVANRGMPVSRAALALVGDHHPSVEKGNLYKHVLESPHTVLPWLGDIIAVPIPVLRNVISIGDVLMCVGAVVLLVRIDFSAPVLLGRTRRRVALPVPSSR